MDPSTRRAVLWPHSTAQGQRLLIIAVLVLLALGVVGILLIAATALGGPHAAGLHAPYHRWLAPDGTPIIRD